MVNNTEEAIEKIEELKGYLKSLRYNPDLVKMLHNLEKMKTELSKKEVLARQTKKITVLETPLKNINESIDNFEKLLIIAKLLN